MGLSGEPLSLRSILQSIHCYSLANTLLIIEGKEAPAHIGQHIGEEQRAQELLNEE